jgi:hypothetical protein
MPRSIHLPVIPSLIRALLLFHAGVALGAGASSLIAEPGPAASQVLNQCVPALGGESESQVAASAPRGGIVSPSPTTRRFAAINGVAPLSLPASPSWSYQVNQWDALLGYAVSLGDLTGDGVEDLIVGAPGFANGEHDEGALLLFAGSPAGLGATPLWTMESNIAEARFGYDAVMIRDVQGDGLIDLLTGVPDFSSDQHEEGVAALWPGGSPEPRCRPTWVIEGNEEDGYFGFKSTGAGDVNGDGYGDVFVGWARRDDGQYSAGRAFVYLGGPTGPGSAPSWFAWGVTGSNEFLGFDAAAGDVNADGFDDLLVGALYHDNGQLDEGAAFLYMGSAAGLSFTPAWSAESNQVITYFGSKMASGDVNGDGYSDMMIGAHEYDYDQGNDGAVFIYHGSPAGLPANPSLVISGPAAGFNLSSGRMATGDVNGDGFDDLLVGAITFSNGQTNEGAVFLYLGSPTGLSGTPAWMAEGGLSASSFGGRLGLGDLNADGLDDVVVSAARWTSPEILEGAVFVYLTQPAVPAGRLSEDDPLTVRLLPGGDIELTWGASCLTGDSDYEIYEGVLGSFASHWPRVCSTGGLQSRRFRPAAGNRYYLVVPRNLQREGSYGNRSDGSERPGSPSPCLPQAVTASCPAPR